MHEPVFGSGLQSLPHSTSEHVTAGDGGAGAAVGDGVGDAGVAAGGVGAGEVP